MIAKVYSAIPCGFEGTVVEVEGDMNRGLPAFNIVGMANKTINEARERVRSAIVNSGFTFPDRKVTINLAPADLTKDGTHLDLPIALAILALSGQLLATDLNQHLFVGELSLDGQIRPVNGIINIVEKARQSGFSTVFVPLQNFNQANLVNNIDIIGVSNLQELFLHLKHQRPIINHSNHVVKNNKTDSTSVFLDYVHGQDLAKRAISIAIAGHHNILISGPPGAGKTLLAKAAANLLPDMSSVEQIDATKIYSLAGLTNDVLTDRPFRSPHHTASVSSIIGGGAHAQPGEISLAHHGILFLDELPEYPRNVIEALRQPLEDKKISISRASQKVTYPADFMLIATMNPCPCGYFGDPFHECSCSPTQIANYRKKLSGPLLDRIDLYVNVQKVDNKDLLKSTKITQNEHFVVKNKVIQTIEKQRKRYKKCDFYNANLSSQQVSAFIDLEKDAEQLLYQASEKFNLSARSYFKIIKVAQTIADFEDSDVIKNTHIAEALNFRYSS